MDPDYWFVPRFVVEAKGTEITQNPLRMANGDGLQIFAIGIGTAIAIILAQLMI